MAKKEFSKFFVASLKRTAQNVSPLLRKKERLLAQVQEINKELEEIESAVSNYDAPIRDITGGFGVSDLVERQVVITGTDANGKPIKASKWVLKYPETVVPVVYDAPFKDNCPSHDISDGSDKEEDTDQEESPFDFPEETQEDTQNEVTDASEEEETENMENENTII